MNSYDNLIVHKKPLRFIVGFLIRLKNYAVYARNNRIARSKGAIIGDYVMMPKCLAKNANHFLSVGDHVIIQSARIDLRNPVSIGNNVIIGGGIK